MEGSVRHAGHSNGRTKRHPRRAGVGEASAEELRSNATRQPGFTSGQSVIDAFSPTRVMTITTWTSMAAWEAWENSPERVSITGRIAGLLQEPPVLRLWGQEEQIDWRQHSTPAVAAGAFAW